MAEDVSTVELRPPGPGHDLENAAAGLPHGGGKSCSMAIRRCRGRKRNGDSRLCPALRNEEDYIFGPDMGYQ